MNYFFLSTIELLSVTKNRLRKNSKKKSSYVSNKIEGNPLTEKQANGITCIVSFRKRQSSTFGNEFIFIAAFLCVQIISRKCSKESYCGEFNLEAAFNRASSRSFRSTA